MLFTRLFGRHTHFFSRTPLLEPNVDFRGRQVASPTDIGWVKLAALHARGLCRDFVDLECLRETVRLDRLELAAQNTATSPGFWQYPRGRLPAAKTRHGHWSDSKVV